jgi:hypothetical protein
MRFVIISHLPIGAIICTVIDGVTRYWQAVYDPVTKTFSNLTINARA